MEADRQGGRKTFFNNRVVFHFNDLLWSQNSCLIKSKRNWTPFFSSKKRKTTQKLQKTPKRQTSSPKKLRKPQKKQTKTSPSSSEQVGLFLVAVVFLLCGFSTSINALNHSLVDFDGVGGSPGLGWSGRVETLKPGANPQGSRGRVTWEQVSQFGRSQVCYLEIFRSWQDAFFSCTLQSLPEGQPGSWFEAVFARDRCPQQHGMRSHQLGQSQGKQDQGKQELPDRSGDSSRETRNNSNKSITVAYSAVAATCRLFSKLKVVRNFEYQVGGNSWQVHGVLGFSNSSSQNGTSPRMHASGIASWTTCCGRRSNNWGDFVGFQVRCLYPRFLQLRKRPTPVLRTCFNQKIHGMPFQTFWVDRGNLDAKGCPVGS